VLYRNESSSSDEELKRLHFITSKLMLPVPVEKEENEDFYKDSTSTEQSSFSERNFSERKEIKEIKESTTSSILKEKIEEKRINASSNNNHNSTTTQSQVLPTATANTLCKFNFLQQKEAAVHLFRPLPLRAKRSLPDLLNPRTKSKKSEDFISTSGICFKM